MNDDTTDLGRIAEEVSEIAHWLTANTHSPRGCDVSDSVTVTKEAWITTVVNLGRLAERVAGLDKSMYGEKECDDEGRGDA